MQRLFFFTQGIVIGYIKELHSWKKGGEECQFRVDREITRPFKMFFYSITDFKERKYGLVRGQQFK